MTTPVHIRWGSIELLHNTIRTLNYLHNELGHVVPTITYRAKVKLHGSNVAVQVTDAGSFPQSRTQMLVGGVDYKGFAQWLDVGETRTYFTSLPTEVTVFGEWCGPGVEKGMAISAVDRKVFAVFGIQKGYGAEAVLIYDPEEIAAILGDDLPDNMFILPWEGDEVVIDFADAADVDKAADFINTWVTQVEAEDPWVKKTFHISGLGEGLVFYPIKDGATDNVDRLAQIMFKAKGDKHRGAGQKAAQTTATVATGVPEFVDQLVTEARLRQGVSEVCGGTVDKKATGKFMQWVTNDVQKESVAELEASGMTWDMVVKPVQTRAREWFLAQ